MTCSTFIRVLLSLSAVLALLAALCATAADAETHVSWICQTGDIQRYFHTWVATAQNCTGPSPPFNAPPFTWSEIGFANRAWSENASTYNLPSNCNKSGALRDDGTSGARCDFHYVLYSNISSCSAIRTLVDAKGWGCAEYDIGARTLQNLAIATVAGCDGLVSDAMPNAAGDICWSFTCAFKQLLDQARAGIPTTPPTERWWCAKSAYNDGKICDSGCGTWDPDCDIISLPTWLHHKKTASGSAVQQDVSLISVAAPPFGALQPRGPTLARRKATFAGRDVARGGRVTVWRRNFDTSQLGYYDTKPAGWQRRHGVPPGWKCPPQYFNQSDGCDCACGAPDPDCDEADTITVNCNGNCSSVTGECTRDGGKPASVTEGAVFGCIILAFGVVLGFITLFAMLHLWCGGGCCGEVGFVTNECCWREMHDGGSVTLFECAFTVMCYVVCVRALLPVIITVCYLLRHFVLILLLLHTVSVCVASQLVPHDGNVLLGASMGAFLFTSTTVFLIFFRMSLRYVGFGLPAFGTMRRDLASSSFPTRLFALLLLLCLSAALCCVGAGLRLTEDENSSTVFAAAFYLVVCVFFLLLLPAVPWRSSNNNANHIKNQLMDTPNRTLGLDQPARRMLMVLYITLTLTAGFTMLAAPRMQKGLSPRRKPTDAAVPQVVFSVVGLCILLHAKKGDVVRHFHFCGLDISSHLWPAEASRVVFYVFFAAANLIGWILNAVSIHHGDSGQVAPLVIQILTMLLSIVLACAALRRAHKIDEVDPDPETTDDRDLVTKPVAGLADSACAVFFVFLVVLIASALPLVGVLNANGNKTESLTNIFTRKNNTTDAPAAAAPPAVTTTPNRLDIAEQPSEYAACSWRYHPKFGVVEAALLAKLAYVPEEVIRRDAHVWFPPALYGELEVERIDTRHGDAVFYNIFFKDSGFDVIIARGSTIEADWLMDVLLWGPSALTKMFQQLWAVPLGSAGPALVEFFAFTSSARFRLDDYVKELAAAARKRSHNASVSQQLLVGHSLGAGLVNIVAASSDGLHSAGFESPGQGLLREQFGWSASELDDRVFTVVTEGDPVPLADYQVGMVQKIRFDCALISCHYMEGVLAELQRACGDPLRRGTTEDDGSASSYKYTGAIVVFIVFALMALVSKCIVGLCWPPPGNARRAPQNVDGIVQNGSLATEPEK